MVSGQPSVLTHYSNIANHYVVGGEILDLALGQAKLRARIVKCGSISAYNGSETESLESFKARGPSVE